jgi:hypothetical protein
MGSKMASDNGITIGQLTEQLNQKMDLPTGVSQDTMDYVVEWKTPTAGDPTWFRKYKSGWVEQGGVLSGTAGWYTVIYPKPFVDNNYTLLASAVDSDENLTVQISGICNKTTTGVRIVNTTSGQTYTTQVSWEAKGQGA